jgi:hypothetical protein
LYARVFGTMEYRSSYLLEAATDGAHPIATRSLAHWWWWSLCLVVSLAIRA